MFALTPREKQMTPLARAEYPLLWMEERLPTLVKRLFETWPMFEVPEWEPRWAMTTEEKEKEVVVRAELPGFEPNEVKVEIKGELLTVEAEHKEPEPAEKKEEKPEKPVRYAHVKRTITLPMTVETEKAEAVYRNGVLEIHLPNKPEVMGRRIEVKS